MASKNMRQLIVPLVQMCTDWLTFLAHGNILLNQTRRIYIASVPPPHTSDFAKEIPEDYKLFFEDNFISK